MFDRRLRYGVRLTSVIVPEASVPSTWLVSGMPTKIVAFITIVSLPTGVQLLPSVDEKAVNTSPVRVTLSQRGGVPLAPVFVVTPPAATRRWNATPLPGLTKIDACAELALSVFRIMTPDFVQALTFSSCDTRTVNVPSPMSCWYANWNSSALPQMSAPAPRIVNTPVAELKQD